MARKRTFERVVFYSVSFRADSPNAELIEQLEQSIRSLRKYNSEIPVIVFWYGFRPDEAYKSITGLATEIIYRGSYFESLLPFGNKVAFSLKDYPLLHRYFNFDYLIKCGASKALYVDCDTYFFADVLQLFKQNDGFDLVARAEVGSYRRSPALYDATYLDEEMLYELASSVGAASVAPFNCGVILWDVEVWSRVPDLAARITDYTWRFLLGMFLEPQTSSRYPEGRGLNWLLSHRDEIQPSDLARALRLPSPNRWLAEEAAVWLAMGEVGGLRIADFDSDQVTYFNEQIALTSSDSIVCHYFGANHDKARIFWRKPEQEILSDSGRQQDSRIVLPQRLARTRLMKLSDGFAVFAGLPNEETLAGLQEEAAELQSGARLQERWTPTYPEKDVLSYEADRHVAPRRRKRSCGGGAVQSDLYANPELTEFLSDEAGIALKPSGERGSYSFYLEGGDFIGLHRDTDYCDLVMITLLQDRTPVADAAGALILYPSRACESCEDIASSSNRAAEVVKLEVGQTLIMFGGAIPHRVNPVRAHQHRVISALCFSFA